MKTKGEIIYGILYDYSNDSEHLYGTPAVERRNKALAEIKEVYRVDEDDIRKIIMGNSEGLVSLSISYTVDRIAKTIANKLNGEKE